MDCHVALVSDWTRGSLHPLSDQDVNCLSCHDFTGALEPAVGHGPTENCYRCHPEVSGPFVWNHDATSSFAVNGEGCEACHSAHGSALDRMLTQQGDALCTQCHAVPPLHRVNHGGLGTRFLCVECHSEVHGSDDNKHFLDLNLGTKIGGTPPSCYCHGVD
jgi:DmsE family decaheme c-type cytochrome